MDAPETVSSHRKQDDEAPRRFTLQRANSALPLARRIAEDVVACYRRFQDIDNRHRELSDQGEFGDRVVPLEDIEKIVAERDRLREKLIGLRDELSEIGVELKDWEIGLVDFPGLRAGNEVCLCWKLGEESVSHWHDPRTGYAGRQSIEREAEFDESTVS